VRPSVSLAHCSLAVAGCLHKHLGSLQSSSVPEQAAACLCDAISHHGCAAMREPLWQSLRKCMAEHSGEARCAAAWGLLGCLYSLEDEAVERRDMVSSMAAALVPRLGCPVSGGQDGAIKTVHRALKVLHSLGLADAVAGDENTPLLLCASTPILDPNTSSATDYQVARKLDSFFASTHPFVSDAVASIARNPKRFEVSRRRRCGPTPPTPSL